LAGFKEARQLTFVRLQNGPKQVEPLHIHEQPPAAPATKYDAVDVKYYSNGPLNSFSFQF
jgi:hypothetical protein